MKWRVVVTLIGGLLIAACALADGQEGRFLEGMTYGPYRGRVIDAETKLPLEGAVAVAAWMHERVYALHSSMARYAARDALTDSDGRFVIDAKAVEERAPRRTLHPEFVVFLPGYAAYGTLAFPNRVFRQGDFAGAGATIGLTRLKTPKERLAQLRNADPHRFSEDPFKDIPHFVQAWNQERVNLRLEPYSPAERKR